MAQDTGYPKDDLLSAGYSAWQIPYPSVWSDEELMKALANPTTPAATEEE